MANEKDQRSIPRYCPKQGGKKEREEAERAYITPGLVTVALPAASPGSVSETGFCPECLDEEPDPVLDVTYVHYLDG